MSDIVTIRNPANGETFRAPRSSFDARWSLPPYNYEIVSGAALQAVPPDALRNMALAFARAGTERVTGVWLGNSGTEGFFATDYAHTYVDRFAQQAALMLTGDDYGVGWQPPEGYTAGGVSPIRAWDTVQGEPGTHGLGGHGQVLGTGEYCEHTALCDGIEVLVTAQSSGGATFDVTVTRTQDSVVVDSAANVASTDAGVDGQDSGRVLYESGALPYDEYTIRVTSDGDSLLLDGGRFFRSNRDKGIHIDVGGHAGKSIDYFTGHAPTLQHIANTQPDFVVLPGAALDALVGDTPSQIAADIVACASAVRAVAPNASLLWPFEWKGKFAPDNWLTVYRPHLLGVCAAAGIHFVDLCTPAGDVRHQVVVITTTGTGTWTITVNGATTDPIAHNANDAAIVAALEALDTVDEDDIVVASVGSAHELTFSGTFALADEAATVGASGSGLTGTGAGVTVVETHPKGALSRLTWDGIHPRDEMFQLLGDVFAAEMLRFSAPRFAPLPLAGGRIAGTLEALGGVDPGGAGSGRWRIEPYTFSGQTVPALCYYRGAQTFPCIRFAALNFGGTLVSVGFGNGTAEPGVVFTTSGNTALQLTAGAIVGSATGKVLQRSQIDAKTGTDYTYEVDDEGALITHSNESAIAATLPTNSAQPFPIGAEFEVVSIGAGTVTVTPSTGVTLNGGLAGAGAGTLEANRLYRFRKIATNTWVVAPALS